jgi:hypothetical protein
MVSTDSNHTSDLKVEDVEEKNETSEAIDSHHDPAFVRKTLCAFLCPPS